MDFLQVRQALEHRDFPSTEERSQLSRQKLLTLEYQQLQGLRELIASNLVPTRFLGKGSFGVVTEETVAFAVKTPHKGKNLKREKDILMSLSHPNIVTFVHYIPAPREVLITEKMMCNLREYIEHKKNNLEINTIMQFASNLAHGLYYLHGTAGYLHDDIKTLNILINFHPDVAKIGDFGFAQKLSKNPNKRDYLHYDHQRYKVAVGFPESFKVS